MGQVAYLQSNPDLEIEITTGVLNLNHLIIPQLPRGFNHLFCGRECFQNCAHAHITLRQNFFWDFITGTPRVIDIFNEKGGDVQ